MSMAIENLPLLTTIKVAGEVLGLTDDQVRGLLRERRIRYVLVGKRYMIPRDAIATFITENTVEPRCQDETRGRDFDSSTSASAITSFGPRTAAAGSAARARQIASKLKSPSSNSCTSATEAPGRVIPLKSS